MPGDSGNQQQQTLRSNHAPPPVARVRVDLMGESLVIRGNTSEEYIRELAAELNQRIQTTSTSHSGESRMRVLLLVALNLMDELRQVRTERAQLQRLLEEAVRTSAAHNHNPGNGK